MLKTLLKLSTPRSPTKIKKHRRITPEIDPESFKDLYRYNMQDVRTEQAISEAIPELSPFELSVWQLDQVVNERGAQIDIESVDACIRVVEAAEVKYAARLREVVDISTITIDQTAYLKDWCNDRGAGMTCFDADAVQEALDSKPCREVREVLEIRQALSSKSVAKLRAMKRMACRDGRIRGMLSYCGAPATGRWAGRGPQPQNLPNHGPAIKRVDEAMTDFKTMTLEQVEAKYGNALETVGSTLRGLFIAKPGHELICSDFSAIEAVVTAELAEESWRQEIFRGDGKIYEATASDLSGIPAEEILAHKDKHGTHHPLRAQGKVGELAWGFGGALGAAKRFGAGDFMTDDEISRAVKKWRRKSPGIVNLWHGLEKAAHAAVLAPGIPFTYKYITYQVRGGILYARTPPGRELTYHNVALEPGKYGKVVAYDGWNSDSTKGAVGWHRRYAWYGVLVENCAQAIARDVLAFALLNLERAGYPIVFHVHDEAIAEVPIGRGSVEEFEFIMAIMPKWATGSMGVWPIKAKGGWHGKRYRKD